MMEVPMSTFGAVEVLMMKQVYDTPAILSLFFPGLGQLAKEQYKRAAMILALIILPWVVWLVGLIVSDSRGDPETLVRSPVFPVVILLNLAVHLWQVVDAYNCPRDFDLG